MNPNFSQYFAMDSNFSQNFAMDSNLRQYFAMDSNLNQNFTIFSNSNRNCTINSNSNQNFTTNYNLNQNSKSNPNIDSVPGDPPMVKIKSSFDLYLKDYSLWDTEIWEGKYPLSDEELSERACYRWVNSPSTRDLYIELMKAEMAMEKAREEEEAQKRRERDSILYLC